MLKKYFILIVVLIFPGKILPYKFNFPPPVELLYFRAEVQNNSVLLTFGTATETDNYGFNIERADSSKTWQLIGFVPGNGTSNSPKDYSFVDTTLRSNGNYFFRLKQIDNTGGFKYSDTVEVPVNFVTSVENETERVNNFLLYQNYPNPFNPSTVINYQLPANTFVSLKIYDVLGNEITTLVNQNQSAGNYSAVFDVETLKYRFDSGVYFYRLTMGRSSLVKKMIYLK